MSDRSSDSPIYAELVAAYQRDLRWAADPPTVPDIELPEWIEVQPVAHRADQP